MSRIITKKEVLQQFENANNEDLFCVYCYESIKKTKEGLMYCPNEMCMNDEMEEK